MRSIIIIITAVLALAFTGADSYAAQAFKGKIVSDKGEPINGAVITAIPENKTTTSDQSGFFKFEKLKESPVSLMVKRIGFISLERELSETERRNHFARIAMQSTPIELEGVVVTEKKKPGEMRPVKTPSIRELDGRQVLSLPGATQDLMRSLTYLPGIVTRSDYSSQLFIRGGGPEQNLVLIDGVTLSNPYRLGTFISAFNPDMVEDVKLIPGGFPAQFGDRLSSVLDIKYRSGDRDKYTFTSNSSIINSSAIFEGPLFDDNGGIIFSLRRTYYDLVLNAIVEDDVAFPYFYDFQGKLDYDFSDKWRGEVLVSQATGGFKLISEPDEDDPDALNLDLKDKNRDGVGSFTLGYRPSDYVDVRTQVAHLSRWEEFRINGDLDLDVNIRGNRSSLKQDALIRPESNDFQLNVGWEAHTTRADFNWKVVIDDSLRADPPPGDDNPQRPEQDEFDYNDRYSYGGVYASLEYKGWNKFVPTVGMRADYSDIVDEMVYSPRLSLNYALNPQDKIKFAWGYYYQFPNYEQLSERGYFPEVWRNSKLTAERAIHYIVGWEHIYDVGLKLRMDLYYKQLDDLLINDGNGVPINSAKGDAEGFEFYFEKIKTNDSWYSGWISYTLARAWKETPAEEYYLANDQTHTINFVADFELTGKLSLGFTWRYGSGMPYTPIVGVEEITMEDSTTGQTVVVDWEPIYGDVNSVRYPAYHRLDTRLSFKFDWLSLPWTAYVEAINTYNQKNIYEYNWNRRYTERETIYELPFVPSFGVAVRFF
ncbi:MAG: TonB-dependent receptor plug domain-containing protein [candidate division Zixibacteria bacterium]|nr:TonB-dependent receptor plug domain-containing protein [candidate division Zixibacteria bacterium]